MKNDAVGRDDLVNVLMRYEEWEADLILNSEAWDQGKDGLPAFTDELWDKLMVLQEQRNKVLKPFRSEVHVVHSSCY